MAVHKTPAWLTLAHRQIRASADTVGPADACQESACHSGGVPCVASLDALHRSVSEFVVTDLDLMIEPSALAAARRSLDSSGLLLGEAHGVRENPLLIRALMKAFGLTSLACRRPPGLARGSSVATPKRNWPGSSSNPARTS
jgi:hypothetical protein